MSNTDDESGPQTRSEANSSAYRQAVESYLLEWDGLVAHVSEFEWQSSDGYLQLVCRATLRHAHELLGAIAALCADGRGDAAVPLLRPACEEYIVVKYLTTIAREDAETLIVAAALIESQEDLSAQKNFSGDDVMRSLGFSERFLDEAERSAQASRTSLNVLATKLAWPRVGASGLPSVRFFARRTDDLDLYDFLYHATSRFVHFKVKELLRRVWGTPTRLTVSGENFQHHYAIFALFWGLWLHLHLSGIVLEEIPGIPPDLLHEERFFDAIRKLGPRVPLITAEEFVWSDRPRPWE